MDDCIFRVGWTIPFQCDLESFCDSCVGCVFPLFFTSCVLHQSSVPVVLTMARDGLSWSWGGVNLCVRVIRVIFYFPLLSKELNATEAYEPYDGSYNDFGGDVAEIPTKGNIFAARQNDACQAGG